MEVDTKEAAKEAGILRRKAERKARKAAEMAEKVEEDDAEPPAKKTKTESSVIVLGAAAYRKAHEIIVPYGDCPDPFETFDASCTVFGSALGKALLAQGYAAPTPIQAQAWPIVLQGKDVVAVAATGSGKTCGFLLPALARMAERGIGQMNSGGGRGGGRGGGGGGRGKGSGKGSPAHPTALVMAPTRELAQQIAVEADKFGPCVKVRTVCIFGGMPKGDQCRELRQGCNLLIATPGRLLDLCAGQPSLGLPPVVEISSVNYLVLDEADRMLDMGFEEDIRKVIDMCLKTGEPAQGGGASGPEAGTMRQTLFFTATWPKEVQRTAASHTSAKAVQIRIGQGAGGDKLTANTKVKQTITVCNESEKLQLLQKCLADELKSGETVVVFAGMKSTCDHLESELKRSKIGCWCKAIHSGKEQWERDGALQEFRDLTAGKNGSKGIMIATDVAARGLDIPGVAMVVVYDFGGKNGVESYVHRIGRTGRAGKTGRAFTFFDRADAGAYPLVELLKRANMDVPKELEDLAWYDWEKQQKKRHFGKGKGKGKGGKGKGKKGGKSKW
eukprot:TRINITY_DN16573_c0_g1_i2.p1 TRINITY_DN16573_c0_g1~~TRINITY_DN16573_c0_g1_i2.p1  ORF type:complete len:558 (+),score=117.80 TRINITY_DN16573_c0_g1_i2:437-2110(+)